MRNKKIKSLRSSKVGKIKDPTEKIARFFERHNIELSDQQETELLSLINSLLANRDNIIRNLDIIVSTHTIEPNLLVDNDIIGGLISCINDHGPITKDLVSSAAKRIKNNIVNTLIREGKLTQEARKCL